MEQISGDVWTWLAEKDEVTKASVTSVRAGRGHRVRNFRDLIEKIAHIAFYNPSLELLYRGQDKDYLSPKGNTTLFPTILRGLKLRDNEEVGRRFHALQEAAEMLCQKHRGKGRDRIRRSRVLQWAILQHYEAVSTPLLDVTRSLRVACTISKLKAENSDSFLYVLGVPYLGGCVSVSGDQGIQALRLLSICPPSAMRPHLQEGYLLSEYPDLDERSLPEYRKFEWDFARRLVCKFVLPRSDRFWDGIYRSISRKELFPMDDEMLALFAQR